MCSSISSISSGSYLLGIGLFDEGNPELVGVGTPCEDKFACLDGQPVVDVHGDPTAESPEMDHQSTPVVGPEEGLVAGDYPAE